MPAIQAVTSDTAAPEVLGAAAELVAFLGAVHGEYNNGLIEIRFRRAAGGMGQCFFAADERPNAARVILGLAARTDVYFGPAPRTTRRGGRAAIDVACAVWADCDDECSVEALSGFELSPSISVRTGSDAGRHAYWLLTEPVAVELIEQLNRRIALALGSDGRSTDGARVLRPPGTQNFKYDPARAVSIEIFKPDRMYRAGAFEGLLPPQPAPARLRQPSSRRMRDPLLSVSPATYARVLLGVTVDRSRKIRCPFHEDRTPSLHLYLTAEDGWYCFGCGRGGTVYDMAAAVWGIGARGEEFHELRSRLLCTFGMEGG